MIDRNLHKNLKSTLDYFHNKYNKLDFIKDDPISIPHLFTKHQDIEISGYFASLFAWGRRSTIINKTSEFIGLMDNEPYAFVMGHKPEDRLRFQNFHHRTFLPQDIYYFLNFFQQLYSKHETMEDFFKSEFELLGDWEKVILSFYNQFEKISGPPGRTVKHISSPKKGSACKRLNLFFRWMIRKDEREVDFGIWSDSIPAKVLFIPLDVHVHRVALKLGLTSIRASNWKSTLQITERLRELDRNDPIKYDYSLFGMGLERRTMMP
jgi:uncharacterized protein (TIGR02757 family)